MILKPVCVGCRCFYRPEKNGYFFIEGMPIGNIGNETIRGNHAPDQWKPYKFWVGDLWKCPECGHEIVVGVIGGPVSEHYMPDFKEVVDRYDNSGLQVNDC